MASIATAATTVSFPPGYYKAFKYQLGVELAPIFGKKITTYPDVMKIASDSFANIKRANKKLRVMQIGSEYSDASASGGYVDWRTGV